MTGAALRRRRVPVVLQLTATECAAACLAMVLRAYGRNARLAECRDACGTGRDGATALALARAARSFGLETRVFSAADASLSSVPLPAVAHWNFNHFVVVERSGPRGVRVVDPAQGRRSLTAEQFSAGFTGVVLTFAPSARFEPGTAPRRFHWRAYFGALLRTDGVRGALAQVLAASLLLQGFGLALPLFTKVLVDQVVPARLESALPLLLAGAAVWIAAQALTGYLRSVLMLYVQARLDTKILLGFFEHLLALPYRFFQQRTTGDLLMRLSSGMILREVLTQQTTSALFDGVLVLTYLALLLAWEPRVAALAVALGLLQIALAVLTTRRVFGLMQREIVAQAEAQSTAVEALGGIATLKASGAEARAVARWHGLFARQVAVALERGRFSAAIDAALTLLRAGAPLLLLLAGSALVLDGSLSLGSMLALTALASSFLGPLASLVASGQNLQLVGAHLERIADVLEAAPEQEAAVAGAGAPPASFRGAAALAGVSFRYADSGPLVLEDIDLAIEPGECVALVGATGSGKSTLLKLLLGLYAPTAGTVSWNGRALEHYPLAALRRRFGVVLQETVLFAGSIRQNIAFNDPALSLDEVRAAARLAAIDAEVAAMPLGYETILSEGGAGLSGGQRQRIALARALATRPAVLFLDEATSHLDVGTEAEVTANLDRLDCTRIVVAHRLSTIRSARRIVVLDGGRIAEEGSHAELLARSGPYARLVGGQLATPPGCDSP